MSHATSGLRERAGEPREALEAVRLLRGVRAVNRILATEEDVERMLGMACEALVRAMGYERAWVAVLDPLVSEGSAKQVTVVSYGVPEDRLSLEVLPGCATRALRTGTTEVCTGTAIGRCGGACPLDGLRRGEVMTAVVATPRAARGVVSVARRVGDAPSSDSEVELFMELGADFGAALDRHWQRRARAEAERALEATVGRLRQAQHLAGMGVWDWEIPTDRTWWSEEMFAIYGIEPATFTGRGRDTLEYTHAADREQQADNVRQAFARAAACAQRKEGEGAFTLFEPDPKEFRVVRPDGQVRHVVGDALCTVDAEGRPLRMLGVLRDITESKRLESALRESEARWRSLVECAPVVIIEVDLERRVRFINRAPMVEAPEVLVGTVAFDWAPAAVAVVIHAKLARVLTLGVVETFTYTSTRTGAERSYLVHAGPVVDAGVVTGATITLSDISEQRAAARALEVLRDQLRAAATQLSAVEERERHRLATVLHEEIGQLLAFARLKLGALSADTGSGEARRELSTLIRVVDDMIAQTRSLTTDLSPPILHELGLEAALEWLVEEVSATSGLSVSLAEPGEAHRLGGDVEPFLYRATRELLLNVVKHARATRAVVRLARSGGSITITVEDDGVGFALEPAIEAAPLRGFGLFSIRERLSHLGGALTVSDRSGGAAVSLTLPLGPAPGAALPPP